MRKILIFLILIAMSAKVFSQNYDWQRVDSLVGKGLAKDAQRLIKSYHTKALKSNDCQNLIASYLYFAKNQQRYASQPFEKSIQFVEADLDKLRQPCKALAQGLLAHFYYAYYARHKYSILDRTYIPDVSKPLDEWSVEDFAIKCHSLFSQALRQRKSLSKYLAKDFPGLFQQGNLSWDLRPTLFDFVAYWALDFYNDKVFRLTRPAASFKVTDKFFKPLQDFVKLRISSSDTLSSQYNSLLIYQSLLKQHLNDSFKNALVEADIQRIRFVYENYKKPDKDSLYEQALKNLIASYPRFKRTDLARYYLAHLYYDQGIKERDNDKLVAAAKILGKLVNSWDIQAKDFATALKLRLEAQTFSQELESKVPINRDFLIRINYQNVHQPVYLRIYKVSEADFLEFTNLTEKFLKQKPFRTEKLKLPEFDDYLPHSVEFIEKGLPAGYYVFMLSKELVTQVKDCEFISIAAMQATDFAIISEPFWQKRFLWVYDRKSGKPLANQLVDVKLEDFVTDTWRDFKKYRTDKNGKVVMDYPESWNDFLVILKNKDDQFKKKFWQGAISYNPPSSTEHIKFFLDRKIYRPGQVVYFKAIAYRQGREQDIQVLPNKKVELEFYDANYKLVKKQSFVTDSFGTFNGQFIVPEIGLTGTWRISTDLGDTYFKVEEYKRPMFEVKFEPIKKAILPGKKVLITGIAKNYNGTPLQNAQVEYTVSFSSMRFIWWYFEPDNNTKVITSGATQTDEKGRFKIEMTTEEDIEPNEINIYNVEAKVTDINGETHSATTSFRVAKQGLYIIAKTPQWTKINTKQNLRFVVQNVMEQQVAGKKLDYKIVLLKPNFKEPKIQREWQQPETLAYSANELHKSLPYFAIVDSLTQPENWQEEQVIAQGKAASSQDIVFKPKKTGVYKVEASIYDSLSKQEIVYSSIIKVFDDKSHKVLAPLPLYAALEKDTVQAGKNARIIVGTAWKDANVYVQVVYNDKIVTEKRLELSNSQKTIDFLVTKDMRGGVGINVWLVKNNRTFSESLTLNVPYKSRKLDIRVERFVDKLRPGQEVTWSFVVTKNNGQKTLAQVLASMYDASLDAFVPNPWGFDLTFPRNSLLKPDLWSISGQATTSMTVNWQRSYEPRSYRYYSFDWRGLVLDARRVYMMAMGMAKSAHPKLNQVSSKMEDTAVNNGQQAETEADFVRKDFSETAFFYPDLLTNDEGEVVIRFKVPQSLTRWNFQMFANTKDLFYGLLSKEAVTTQELMLFPNEPRFVRQGDTLVFSAKVVNNSGADLKVDVILKIFNAQTNRELDVFEPNQTQTVTIKKDSSALVSWKLIIPEDLTAPLLYRIIAKSDKYSDGQQNIIPVLSNRMLVTESLPLPVNGNQTKTFVIDKLWNKTSKTIKPYKLTLEFNSNPVWYAVAAIPYLMEYPYECNEQIFSRFYANALASYIVNSNPDIKRVYDIWKKQKSQALVSELEKKQQLKQIVLDATPWLLEGATETEAKQRIALLFDLNKMAYEQNKVLDKLFDNQNSDGGWPWFKGGKSDWFITQYILTGFARLRMREVYNFSDKYYMQISNAVLFVDREVEKYYYELKRRKYVDMNANHLSPTIVQYLYMRPMFYNIEFGRVKLEEWFEYFYTQLKKYWSTLGLYSQAQAAIAFAQYGDTTYAREVLKSLKQRALYSDEMGYYWAENKPSWFWYREPISTQAMLIEAFDRLTNDTNFVEGAKRWLLKQKQTTHWETTIATDEAVWSLMFTGYNWLGENQPIEITIGKQKYPTPDQQVEAGTGYFMKTWDAQQITSDMGKIVVTNPNHHPTWGAVYYQYFENIDKVKGWNTKLRIKRELFKLVQNNQGSHLEQITKDTPLKVGDQVVVRLVIQTDRNLEYVHIKDLRPSGFEPVEQLSGYRWKGGLGYYQSIRDASANFFVSFLRKGKYVFEYNLFVTMPGSFSGGLTTIQCMYAPEFAAHSQGQRVEVEK